MLNIHKEGVRRKRLKDGMRWRHAGKHKGDREFPALRMELFKMHLFKK